MKIRRDTRFDVYVSPANFLLSLFPLSFSDGFEERTCLEWLKADSLRASDPRYATPSRFHDSRIASFKTRNDAFQPGQVDPFSAVKIRNS